MPFAGYKDFADCCAKNSNKKNPKAYCSVIMRATEKPTPKKEGEVGTTERRITDLIDVNEAEFSIEESTGRMLADVTILRAGRSKNPRNYTEGSLQRAAVNKVFDGARMFVNHSDKPPLKRSLTEMVSAVTSTRYNDESKKLSGTVQFFNKEFFEFARNAKEFMGCSINALARGDRIRQPDGQVIENVTDIVKGHSVDWVIYPAAGGEIQQFMESEGDEEVEWDKITLEDLITNGSQDLWNGIREHVGKANSAGDKDDKKDEKGLTEESLKEIVAQAIKEHDEMVAKERSELADTATKVQEKVSTSGLPTKTQARIVSSFAGVRSFNEAAVTEAIESAKEELKAAGAGPRITGMGTSESGKTTSHPSGISVAESVESFFRTPKKSEEKK